MMRFFRGMAEENFMPSVGGGDGYNIEFENSVLVSDSTHSFSG
jgi:hypothetical protein